MNQLPIPSFFDPSKAGKIFRTVFAEMGILDQWILTPSSEPSSIRKAFQVFSQSAVRASQNAVNFSQQVIGGFGA